MAGLSVLFPKLMTYLKIAVKMPFSLCKLVCTFCMKTTLIVIQTWMELIKAAVSFQVKVLWKAVIWTVALVSLPIRVFTALQRERLLEQHVHKMQFELETLIWNMKELEDRFQAAVRECRIMELLTEVEEEHDKAVSRIELLEVELPSLKNENLRLKEIPGKTAWSLKGHDETNKSKGINTVDNHVIPYSVSSWISSYKGSGISLQDLMMNKEEAEDPCMPLVVVLFTVVGMSLKSVIQFFFTMKNKPASEVVALLSVNWFILGTLCYPTLPRVTHLLAPLALSVVDRMASWLGIVG
ncbi:hypothetical protein DITRI_Ditri07aG0179500 [Diplodiscus trichospermus]